MKYKELERVAIELAYSIRRVGNKLVIESESSVHDKNNTIVIMESRKDEIIIDIWANGPHDLDMLQAAMKYSNTPPEDRYPEKKYYLKHKFLLSDKEYRFLNYLSNFDSWDLSASGDCSGYQTKFTQKEIEDIKEKYDTTLDDFEFIEVEK